MDEERIWAPWRIGYVAGELTEPRRPVPVRWPAEADHDCFLCQAGADYDDPQAARQLLVIERHADSLIVMNRFPYANGHLLVCPRRHVADLDDMTEAEHLAALHGLTHWKSRLSQLIAAEGFNIGLNLGVAGGAGAPGHLHWHLVPRWTGDANFMPAVAGVRVIPQSLTELWTALVGDDSSASSGAP